MYVQGSYGSWKTWNVLECYCGIFQSWSPVLEKDTGPGKFWKSVKSVTNMKCMADSKENLH